MDRWVETLPAFFGLAGRLSPLAPPRNLLAHEYLDLRLTQVRAFARDGAPILQELAKLVRVWLESAGSDRDR